MEPGAILVAALAAGAILLIVLGLSGSSPVDPVQARLTQLGTMQAKNLEELELQAPFMERTLRPLAASLSGRMSRMQSSSFTERTEKRLALAGNPGDLRTSDWRLKLLVQILGGAILVAGGLSIKVLYVPFVGAWNLGFWSFPATLLWVVVLTNSINLIDGLDGLAAGVSLIVAATLFLAGYFLQIPLLALFALSLAGALAGFLPFNYFPARIFMGDSGSLVVGFE